MIAPFGGLSAKPWRALVTATIVETGVTHRPGVRAARCALAIRAQHPSATVTLTAHVGEPGAAVVHNEATVVAPGAVVVDDLAASLLEGRFDVHRESGVQQLWAERVAEESPRLFALDAPRRSSAASGDISRIAAGRVCGPIRVSRAWW